MENIFPLENKPRNKREEKYLQLRNSYFKNVEGLIWNRKFEKGFTTIPRSLPLIMSLLKILGTNKDSSLVYFQLWSEAFDEGFIDAKDQHQMAYASGYVTKDRGLRSWGERILELERLGFIRTAKVGTVTHRYILLLNPHLVIEKLNEDNIIPEDWYNAYVQRMAEIKGQIPSIDSDEYTRMVELLSRKGQSKNKS